MEVGRSSLRLPSGRDSPHHSIFTTITQGTGNVSHTGFEASLSDSDVRTLSFEGSIACGLGLKQLSEVKWATARDVFEVISEAAPERFNSRSRNPAAELLGAGHARADRQAGFRPYTRDHTINVATMATIARIEGIGLLHPAFTEIRCGTCSY
jgi:hypothetical protein